ncbi:hypothetical protein KCV87_27020 [Actinosynnema pretiosum subsp. pretiosum]|uniref:Uncharacterized protein n=2 Tax=Actinosynnema TaxID=40566 RepID=C6WDF8_ACTMD|nr:hypothetical protein [Actinosynnema mirum]ACU39595.1 hypothetical protein Amir_5782 [Actinosynnema mirum DSM 43827]AXX33103.1 hypothetical protein APASM_5738 [Actinosynnema pretiosum subsp. pretiosum]QUF03050.1 hypothetical protein KCV87_27020 [Actinosynnema pretiosum subsp. pretiosum]
MNRREAEIRSRRKFTERLACALLFSAIQLWALAVVLTRLEVDGVTALAIAFCTAGGLVALYDAWSGVRVTAREIDQEINQEEELARF